PANQQPQIRTQLSNVLEGIMCQALLPNSAATGRVMAMEILIPNSAVRNLIREDKIHQIYSMMQTGNDKFGMQTLNQSLAALYRKRDITLETALTISSNTKELLDLVGRGQPSQSAFAGGSAAASRETVGGIRPQARARVSGAGDEPQY
ncbi:MAG: type IV pili twitching motility protein PilT, partial [Acidobacteriota bacterium]